MPTCPHDLHQTCYWIDQNLLLEHNIYTDTVVAVIAILWVQNCRSTKQWWIDQLQVRKPIYPPPADLIGDYFTRISLSPWANQSVPTSLLFEPHCHQNSQSEDWTLQDRISILAQSIQVLSHRSIRLIFNRTTQVLCIRAIRFLSDR